MKICTYNLENLYIGMDKYSNENLDTMSNEQWSKLSISVNNQNKNLYKTQELAKNILKIDADIYCVQEVMSKYSLVNFNKHFLNEQYNIVLHESNSNRNIFVGFLIKKHIEYEIFNYSSWKLNNGQYPSRNLTGIIVKENNNHSLALLGVHLKSKRVDEKNTNSYNVRECESELLSRIYVDLEQKYNCPIAFLGDFNANINLEPEFHHLNNLGLFDFVKEKYKEDYLKKVGTFSTPYNESKVQQLDFILLSKKYETYIDYSNSDIILYENEYGDKITLPYEILEKAYLPSDHCPLVLTLRFK